MSGRQVDFLLIGGGIAAAACARTLREEGADGSILLATREIDPPYHRPPASKGYLQGRETREETLVLPPGWWEDSDVELRTRSSVAELASRREPPRSARRRSGSTRRWSPRGRWSAACRSRGPRTSTASTTCARSATPTRSAATPRRQSASCWWAARTSAARSQPR